MNIFYKKGPLENESVGPKQITISVIAPDKNAIAQAGMIDALVLTLHTIEASP